MYSNYKVKKPPWRNPRFQTPHMIRLLLRGFGSPAAPAPPAALHSGLQKEVLILYKCLLRAVGGMCVYVGREGGVEHIFNIYI
jgi:hypothetical protein